MKKSRIIVPALAMLTLSVAASVTGTVAWFTASRAASATLNDLVAIDTAGDLSMTLTSGNAIATGKTVALKPLRDFSYCVSTVKNNAGTGYIALLNDDGNTVTATRQITNYTDPYGRIVNTDVYYANTFSATFSTETLVNSYLFFNNNVTKSHLLKDYTGTNSIYQALRVSMKATNSNDTDGSKIKIITWAPYTSLNPETNEVYNVNEAATIANGGVSITDTDIGEKYHKSTGEQTTSPIVEATKNVVKKADADPITEANTSEYADKSNFLLSNQLIGGDNKVTVTVNFVIWFEGLDPACLSGKQDISTVLDQTKETISMGFYAIPVTSFAA